MTLHPNSIKRLVGAVLAVAAVMISFDLLSPRQAESLTAAVPAIIAGVAAIWHPRHGPRRPKRNAHRRPTQEP